MITQIKNSLTTYKDCPQFAILFVALYLILSVIGLIPSPTSYSPLTDYIYTIGSSIIYLLLYSLIFSILIGAAFLAFNKKFSFKESLNFSKYTWKNFLFLLPVVVVQFLLQTYTKDFFVSLLGPITAAILFEIIFVLVSSLAIIFVMKNTINSRLNKTKYLLTLLVFVVYYILTFLVSLFLNLFTGTIEQLLYIIIYFIIIYPLVTLILVSIFKNK